MDNLAEVCKDLDKIPIVEGKVVHNCMIGGYANESTRNSK
jgi:hypothetical protein